jgi:hypothetical protein
MAAAAANGLETLAAAAPAPTSAPAPAPAPNEALENFISIKCVDQQQREVLFKLRMNTRFDRVFARFADEMKLPVHSLRFLFDGDRVSPEQTPSGLVMEDGDTIDVHVEQTGGGRRPTRASLI